MKKNKNIAFTLVELIVVITILAILGTIAFVSFQGYTISARDSVRVSDLGTIARGLDYFKLQQGYYPSPTDSYNVTYSGSVAWEQGVFGDATRQVTKRISETPVDPLTGNSYAYSVTNTKQEYELGSITEGLITGDVHPEQLLPLNSVYADNSFFTYIKGNYNRQIVTVKEVDKIIVLGVPTIITTEIQSVDVRDVLLNQRFAVSGSKNLPASYSLSLPEGQTHSGSISFTAGPVDSAPVLFEGSINDLSGSDAKQLLGVSMKSYYAESNLGEKQLYKSIGELSSGQEYKYINTLIQSDTAGLSSNAVKVSNQTPSNIGSVAGNATHPSTCMEMSQENLDNLNNWMSISLGDVFNRDNVNSAYGTTGTSNLTLAEWCNIIQIEAQSGTILSDIPQEVGYLYDLEFLFYTDQGIDSIPETLTRLEKLKDINLEGNQLGNLELTRFDWENGYTCENGVGDNGNNMCIELVNSGGEGGEGGEGGSDTIRIVTKGPEHVLCEDVMTDVELAQLNNWGTSTLANSGNELTIAPTGTSSLTKREWCGVYNLTNATRDSSALITYIPEALSKLQRLESIVLPNEDIQLAPLNFNEFTKLQYIDFSENFELGNLSSVFNSSSSTSCQNFTYSGGQLKSVCVGGDGDSYLQIEVNDVNAP